ncbi:MAG: hypothetical protein KDN22_05615 [Verrucomicrobiae bacterium]|nr:hypothetical protein [Verrucomicrobiae bacterium]
MRATFNEPTITAAPKARIEPAAAIDAIHSTPRETSRRMVLARGAISFTCFAAALYLGDHWVGRELEHLYFHQQSGDDWNTTETLMHSEADIEIFGDSRGSHHYNPKVIEEYLDHKVTCHNGSRTAQTILYSDAVQKALLERHKPRLIILDLNPAATVKLANAAERLSVLSPYYDDVPAIQPILESRSPYERFKLLSHCYRFNSRLPTLLKYTLQPETSDLKGHKPLIGQFPPRAFLIPNDSPTADQVPALIDPALERALVSFVQRANAAKVRVILVSSPIHGLSFERTSEALALKALEGLDFQWWDYLEDSRFYGHTEKFFDRAHLKGAAAEEFSRIIADRVKPVLTRPVLAQKSAR